VDLYPLLASIELGSLIVSGDQQYGAFVALNGGARHGEQGVSRSGRIVDVGTGSVRAPTYQLRLRI
jgi:hypothetical protein